MSVLCDNTDIKQEYEVDIEPTSIHPPDVHYNFLPVKTELSDSSKYSGIFPKSETYPALLEACEDTDVGTHVSLVSISHGLQCPEFGVSHIDRKFIEDSVCTLKDTNVKGRPQHMRDEKIYVCSVCQYKTTYRKDLISHLRHHTGELFECWICERIFTQKATLKKHLGVHMGEKHYECSECQYKTAYQNVFINHFRRRTSEKHECSICKRKFTQAISLKRHLGVHMDDKPFKCCMCDYRTTWNGYLKRHMASHTEKASHTSKAFRCSICRQQFTINGHLKRHMSVHADEKPYVCSVCGYKTASSDNLKKHVVRHSDQVFRCPICKRKFTQSVSVRRHINEVHNGERRSAQNKKRTAAKLIKKRKHGYNV